MISTTGHPHRRIPTLDGWRGLAILIVLFDHYSFHFRPQYLEWIGADGVAIFFVLSGFLITSNLLAESDSTGNISLKSFYVRRVFRLIPCAWAYLMVLGLLGWLHPSEAIGCIFFFRAALPMLIHPSTDHFWSLSIEEDFYLIWPVVLVALGNRKALKVVTTGAIVLGVLGIIGGESFNFISHFVRSPILVGCILAFIPRRRLPWHELWVTVALLGLGAFMYETHVGPTTLLESMLIAFLIWSTSQGAGRWLCWVLETRVMVGIGVISYSLYVWQQIVAFHPPFTIAATMMKLYLVGTLALSSYCFIERPMRRIGREVAKQLADPSEPTSGGIEYATIRSYPHG